MPDAYRDQEVARLFGQCGWGQERIARHMGKRQQWVSLRLIFGRFLAFTTSGCNSQIAGLTERRFREHYKSACQKYPGKQQSVEKERLRFAHVLHALANGIAREPFNPEEKVDMARRLAELEKPRMAAERNARIAEGSKRRWAKKRGEVDGEQCSPSTLGPSSKQVREIVAEAVGASFATIDRAGRVVDAARAEPEKYGDLLEEMNKAGKVERAAPDRVTSLPRSGPRPRCPANRPGTPPERRTAPGRCRGRFGCGRAYTPRQGPGTGQQGRCGISAPGAGAALPRSSWCC